MPNRIRGSLKTTTDNKKSVERIRVRGKEGNMYQYVTAILRTGHSHGPVAASETIATPLVDSHPVVFAGVSRCWEQIRGTGMSLRYHLHQEARQ
jgi:hypothetical protein